jgi:hypothetical protein
MFEHLSSYDRIVVTGPQRSGTTIAGRMIAADTGHRYVDEGEFGVYDSVRWREILTGHRIVVQCPHMLKVIVDDPPPGVLVVLMRRDLADIHASERRIRWEEDLRGNTRELESFGLSQGDSARLKYDYWDTHPRPACHLEVAYDSLRTHPAYVAPEQRASFGRKQTSQDVRGS